MYQAQVVFVAVMNNCGDGSKDASYQLASGRKTNARVGQKRQVNTICVKWVLSAFGWRALGREGLEGRRRGKRANNQMKRHVRGAV